MIFFIFLFSCGPGNMDIEIKKCNEFTIQLEVEDFAIKDMEQKYLPQDFTLFFISENEYIKALRVGNTIVFTPSSEGRYKAYLDSFCYKIENRVYEVERKEGVLEINPKVLKISKVNNSNILHLKSKVTPKLLPVLDNLNLSDFKKEWEHNEASQVTLQYRGPLTSKVENEKFGFFSSSIEEELAKLELLSFPTTICPVPNKEKGLSALQLAAINALVKEACSSSDAKVKNLAEKGLSILFPEMTKSKEVDFLIRAYDIFRNE